MKHKDNILKLKDCYGCGVCVKACPVKIISLEESKEGFYQPTIKEEDKCIECSRCLKVCAFNHEKVASGSEPLDAYGCWSKNYNVRLACSSGGAGFEFGRALIEEGYEAVGVKFNAERNRAEHFVAQSVRQFWASVGSKYIPSDMSRALSDIDPKKKYFVSGTPCQIDSFRRYIRMVGKEGNFILLDFFCHGVPSLLLWDRYSEDLEKKLGGLSFVAWRSKQTGWHDSWSMQAEGQGATHVETGNPNFESPAAQYSYSSRMSEGDLFYRLFLDNYCLNECCYSSCKYKVGASAADIRIGDAWGKTYRKNFEGVTAVVAMSEKGREVIEQSRSLLELEPQPFSIFTEGQMARNARRPAIRDKVIYALERGWSLPVIMREIVTPYRRRFLPGRLANRLLALIGINPKFRTR